MRYSASPTATPSFADGAMIGEGLIADVSQDDLVRMMVGRAVAPVYPKKE